MSPDALWAAGSGAQGVGASRIFLSDVSMATPADRWGEFLFLCKFWAVHIIFGDISGRFSDPVRVFRAMFRIQLNFVRRQFRSEDMPP